MLNSKRFPMLPMPTPLFRDTKLNHCFHPRILGQTANNKFINKVLKVCVVFLAIQFAWLPVSGQDCEPQDCILSQWKEWSPCSQSCGDAGIRSRSRTELQGVACGGKCDANTTQEEPCNRKCCPKNCVFSQWTKWSSCQCYSDR